MEVFPEVRAIIDLNIFKDKANEALNIIQSGKSIEKCKNYGNSYEVIDSFEKINDIHTQLLKLKMRPSAAEPTRSSRTETSRLSGAKSTRSSGTESIRPSDDNATRPSDFNSARSPDAESARSSSHFELSVNETILNYIREIYGSKLQKLEKDFDVSIKMNHSGDNNVTVQYTSNKNGSVSRGATDSFLTLYQQVATNLTMEMIKNPGRRTIKKDTGASLQKKFPKVLLIPKETEFIIMGEPADVSSYAHILKSELDQLDSYSIPDATNSNRRPPLSSEYKSKMYSASASKLEVKAEDLTCSFCGRESEDRETIRKCKHSFCKDCIIRIFKAKSVCPLCGEFNSARPFDIHSNRSSGTESTRPPSNFELPVNETILNYITEIYRGYLQKLEKDFDVSIKMNHSGENNITVQYTSNKNGSVSRGATDSFLTLYQQVATNLTMEMIKNPGRRTIKKDTGASLQKKFPKVLLIPKETEFIIMGEPADVSSYAHILKSELDQLDSYSIPDATNSNRRPPLSSEYKSKMYSASASKLEAKGEDSTCPICLEEIENRETLKKCKHSFCKDCINVAFKTKSACPICGELYGEIIGTQPEGGKMSSRNMQMSLPGYEKFETIEIHYTIPDGIQGAEHPHPGQRYYGTTRTAYLPDNAEGRKVYKLLRRAFEQRLIFTVGTSSTTGRSNVVTWNDIHHKTNTMGGPSMFGYPDPTYLARVQDELKAKGIY
ncbi:E3 ubiquitin-protein ligase DTX3L [Chiloscyllium punctatum]|uniref:E3 ubiquitin-protein ligase DTX3L n=1 Tax=Chiloscyllium punctatum TaxID=137246 RepID=UPI003B63263C